jgi:hypothetical protein
MKWPLLFALLAGCGGADVSGGDTTMPTHRHGLSELRRDYDQDCVTAPTDAQFNYVVREAGHHGWDAMIIGPDGYCIQRPHREESPAGLDELSRRR